MDPQPPGEVIGDERGEPIGERLWLWFLGHRWALVLVIVSAAVVAGFFAVRAVRGPALPPVAVVRGESGQVGPWAVGPDERPQGPVVLSFTATVQRQKSSGALVGVVGITGPGVVRADNPVTPLVGDAPVPVPLRVVLNCPAVPAAVPATAYGLRIEARSGSRTSTKVITAGATAEGWRRAILLACSSWTARTDLTVSTLTASVDPLLSRVDVRLTVTNSGSREGQVLASTQFGPPIRVLGGLPLRVPPHGSASAALSVVLDRCDTVDDPRDVPSPPSQDDLLTSKINVYALAGPVTFGAPEVPGETVNYGAGEGLGPTAVVMDAGPAQALTSALSEACGGIGPILPLISPGTVQLDPRTGELSVSLMIDVTPGRVRRVRLATDPLSDLVAAGASPGDLYRPLWTTFPDLVPDFTGQVLVRLHYRAPTSNRCPTRGGFAPGFVATLSVPVAAGVRLLKYSGGIDLAEDPEALSLLCRSS